MTICGLIREENKMLDTALKTLGLEMPEAQQKRLLAFMTLLQKWNQTYNLTSIENEKMLTHHILDSLAVVPYLKGERILDVGTGAGFPGIPLAFYFPEKHFTLLDSNGKKTRFLIQAKAELGIDNIDVVQSRVEAFHTEDCFDAIIFRAVKSIEEIVGKSRHLCCKRGQFLAMKGSYPAEELKAMTNPVTVHELKIPGLQAKRHLVILQGVSSD